MGDCEDVGVGLGFARSVATGDGAIVTVSVAAEVGVAFTV